MRNIKLYRLALVNREKESKELWTVVRRNPALRFSTHQRVRPLLNACSALADCSCGRNGHAWATNCWVSWWW